jgi:hypothetical protein
MFPTKFLLFLFQLKLLTGGCGCEVRKQGFSHGNKHFSVKKLSKLPNIVNESSGIVMSSNHFLTGFQDFQDSVFVSSRRGSNHFLTGFQDFQNSVFVSSRRGSNHFLTGFQDFQDSVFVSSRRGSNHFLTGFQDFQDSVFVSSRRGSNHFLTGFQDSVFVGSRRGSNHFLTGFQDFQDSVFVGSRRDSNHFLTGFKDFQDSVFVSSRRGSNHFLTGFQDFQDSVFVSSRRDSVTFWTHNDSGGKPEIYEIDLAGNLHNTLPIPNTQNIDWEDITKDNAGNLYIADIGNNTNTRRNLTIYKVAPLPPYSVEKINFHYADQSQFPPKPEEMNFDSESLFWANDSLYFFSKNRGKKLVSIYTIPAKAGEYAVIPKAQISIKGMVTGAAISPSGTEFALLVYGKVLFFEVNQGNINFSKPKYCMKFAHKQTEAITYLSEDKLLITNEQGQIFLLGMRRF